MKGFSCHLFSVMNGFRLICSERMNCLCLCSALSVKPKPLLPPEDVQLYRLSQCLLMLFCFAMPRALRFMDFAVPAKHSFQRLMCIFDRAEQLRAASMLNQTGNLELR